jgi:hypothetical protein
MLRDFDYDGHVARLCQVYGDRCKTMRDAIERHFPAETRWTKPDGGLFIWVELPTTISAEELFAEALQEQVAFVPGACFFAGEPPINKTAKEEEARQAEQPDWLLIMPAGIRRAHEYWKQHLKPGGFGFAVRVISYPGGKPGDIGVFITWPKSPAEA